MTLHDQALGLFVFFPILTTITVGLRLFVRVKLCKGAFGWDDVALLITYVGLLLWVGFSWKAVEYGAGEEQTGMYHAAKNDVCYVISGVVKISVALVLYRLDTRKAMRHLLIADMIICAIWTVIVTFILGLGCTGVSPPSMRLGASVCEATNYAQEASYVIFNVLHVVIPVFIVWGVQIQGNLKWAVVSLFGVGLLAAIAAIMKLQIFVKLFHATSATEFERLWYQGLIWTVCEHGLSLFAASIIAIRPFFTFVSKSWTSLSSSLNSSGSKDTAGRATSSHVSKNSNMCSPAGTELGTIGVRSDFEVRSEYNVENGSRNHAYTVDAYNESSRMLVKESKGTLEPGNVV